MLKSISPEERDDVIDIARRKSNNRIDRHAIIDGLTQVYASSPGCITDCLAEALTEVPASREGSDLQELETTLRSTTSFHYAFNGLQQPPGLNACSITHIGRSLLRLWLDYCRERAAHDADTFIEQWLNEEVAA